jgi:hypothetical protein
MIIETSIQFISSIFNLADNINIIPLAKLHGSIDSEIVPPTWRKSLPKSVKSAWSNSCKWISEANQIRVLGYSMPDTDVYIKYLLSAGIIQSKNIRQIDVICLDPCDHVKKRFDKLISFPHYRFAKGNIESFLQSFHGIGSSSPPFKTGFSHRRVENIHNDFMKKYSQ